MRQSSATSVARRRGRSRTTGTTSIVARVPSARVSNPQGTLPRPRSRGGRPAARRCPRNGSGRIVLCFPEMAQCRDSARVTETTTRVGPGRARTTQRDARGSRVEFRGARVREVEDRSRPRAAFAIGFEWNSATPSPVARIDRSRGGAVLTVVRTRSSRESFNPVRWRPPRAPAGERCPSWKTPDRTRVRVDTATTPSRASGPTACTRTRAPWKITRRSSTAGGDAAARGCTSPRSTTRVAPRTPSASTSTGSSQTKPSVASSDVSGPTSTGA